MVTANMSAPTVIVHHLIAERPARPSLFHRLLALTEGPARRPRRPKRPPRAREPLPFAVTASRASAVILPDPPHGLGIRPGTWVAVTLRRGVTDVDSTLVVFHVEASVHGLWGVLPAGTRLLGRVEGPALGRIRVAVSQAVTPRGRRLPFDAAVFGADREPGLPAYVVGGRRKTILAALASSVVEGVDALIGAAASQGSEGAAALGQVGTNTLNAAAVWRAPHRILYAPAQQGYVQTQKGS